MPGFFYSGIVIYSYLVCVLPFYTVIVYYEFVVVIRKIKVYIAKDIKYMGDFYYD